MLDNDQQLVEQARQDPAAFGALYDRYVDRIFAYTARLMQDEAAAQDVTAVTFEKALKQIRQHGWQCDKFVAWLYRIARNEAMSRLRRQKWLSPKSWFGSTELRETETAVQSRQTNQAVQHALARLRPQDRDGWRITIKLGLQIVSGLWVDLHLRLNDNVVKEPAISILRGAYLFYLNDNNRLAAGYAYVTQYANVEGAPNIPEHRLWQQIQWFEKKEWLSLMQWVRLEERFRRKVEDNELASGQILIIGFGMRWRLPSP